MPSIAGNPLLQFRHNDSDAATEEQPPLGDALESLHEGTYYARRSMRGTAKLTQYDSIAYSRKAANSESLRRCRYHLSTRSCPWT
jgi:hypothetical protein